LYNRLYYTYVFYYNYVLFLDIANTLQTHIGGVDQQDDGVMVDNVMISCTVGDEEALVDKANSCIGSRRRPVRQKVTRQHKGISKTTTRQSKRNSGLGK